MPDVLRTLGAGEVAEVAGGELVVVEDVQALAAIRAREHGRLQRIAVLAAMADEAGRARARSLPGPLRGALDRLGAHAAIPCNDTPGHGVCTALSSLPSAIHSSSAMCGAKGPSTCASSDRARSSA